jgi:hypothetical protein
MKTHSLCHDAIQLQRFPLRIVFKVVSSALGVGAVLHRLEGYTHEPIAYRGLPPIVRPSFFPHSPAPVNFEIPIGTGTFSVGKDELGRC